MTDNKVNGMPDEIWVYNTVTVNYGQETLGMYGSAEPTEPRGRYIREDIHKALLARCEELEKGLDDLINGKDGLSKRMYNAEQTLKGGE